MWEGINYMSMMHIRAKCRYKNDCVNNFCKISLDVSATIVSSLFFTASGPFWLKIRKHNLLLEQLHLFVVLHCSAKWNLKRAMQEVRAWFWLWHIIGAVKQWWSDFFNATTLHRSHTVLLTLLGCCSNGGRNGHCPTSNFLRGNFPKMKSLRRSHCSGMGQQDEVRWAVCATNWEC